MFAQLTLTKVLGRGCAIVICVVAFAHLAITALYLSPPNPLQRAVAAPLHAYMDPVFTQNWKLFAPTPENTNNGLLVRARTPDGETDFVDLTTPEVKARQHTVLPPLTARTVSSAEQLLSQGAQNLVTQYEALHPGLAVQRDQVEAKVIPDPVINSSYKSYYERAKAYAINMVCRKALNGNVPIAAHAIEQLQFRVVTYAYPRYETRNDPTSGDVSYVTYPQWKATC